MNRSIPPCSPKPDAAKAVGPRNDAEKRLYDLVVEGLSSGEGTEYGGVDALAAEFRDRLKSRRG